MEKEAFMAEMKTAKDIMVDVFEFPHIPYWFTIRQAIGIIKKSLLSGDKCHHPMAVLVFDEKYNLMGTLALKDILRGIEPSFLKPAAKAQVIAEDVAGLASLWSSKESKALAEKPVSEVMAHAKQFVEPGDPLTKAAYLMLHNDLILVPVLENKKKLVGIVRMIEVFDEIAETTLKD
jgi:Mg/Co/Ni transporter MgtE